MKSEKQIENKHVSLMSMALFLLIFFLLYGGIHLYVLVKAKSALSFGTLTDFYLYAFMLIMTLAPLIIRWSEKFEFENFARFMAYAGYSWMGILFLFFSASLCLDIYHLIIHTAGHTAGLVFHKDLSTLIPSTTLSFYMPLILSLAIAIYGYFEALNIRTERVVIKTHKIPEEIGRLRIVHISDVHVGLIVGEKRLMRILAEIKNASPDILVSTGDLVDGQIDNITKLADLFKEIQPAFGKFAVTGNHEFYAGMDQALNFTKKAGFRVLRGEGIATGGIINIAGVDDPDGKRYNLYIDMPEKELLSSLPADKFTILLKHRPEVDNDAQVFFDLQLSGHTHKGQIFPFSIITELYYRNTTHAGKLRLVNDSYLYVSRGTGTWGPPMRFLSPPEVTVIDLIHKPREN
jgi:predicted MPP superfamily phosphohydrolase